MRWSHDHKTHSKHDREYWDWTWDELELHSRDRIYLQFDLRAMLEVRHHHDGVEGVLRRTLPGDNHGVSFVHATSGDRDARGRGIAKPHHVPGPHLLELHQRGDAPLHQQDGEDHGHVRVQPPERGGGETHGLGVPARRRGLRRLLSGHHGPQLLLQWHSHPLLPAVRAALNLFEEFGSSGADDPERDVLQVRLRRPGQLVALLELDAAGLRPVHHPGLSPAVYGVWRQRRFGGSCGCDPHHRAAPEYATGETGRRRTIPGSLMVVWLDVGTSLKNLRRALLLNLWV